MTKKKDTSLPTGSGRKLKVMVKTARGRTVGQVKWLQRQLNDPYVAAARTQGGAYATQAQCLDKFPACIPRADVPAWTPRPNGYCIARGPDGEVAHVEPVYAIR